MVAATGEMRAVPLADLVRHLPGARVYGAVEREITAVQYDSRAVGPGALFAAVPGFHTDGHRFVDDAVRRGAAAVMVEPMGAPPDCNGATVIVVPDSRAALGRLAAAFYGYPGRRLGVVGITGTDGKTTTSFLIERVLAAAGYRTGLMGTVDFKVADRTWSNDSRQTTPEAPEVQALLADMVAAGVDWAVVESTSHGLTLHRLTDCEYDSVVFTNVTSDHLDFHRTREAYLEAKATLLDALDRSVEKGFAKTAVLNADDSSFAFLLQRSPVSPITYGIDRIADVRATDVSLSAKGSVFTVESPLGSIDVAVRLPGRFNVYNALAAFAFGLSRGLPAATIREGIESLAAVPGRMERVDCGQDFGVIIDYAHTPDSLEKLLATARQLTRGRILLVFGCAGERDRGKRPVMGAIAGRACDFFVLTDEDPRLEDREAILREVAAGAEAVGRARGADYEIVPDRPEAIATAMRAAWPGDLVLLAGKGHEHCIISGTTRLPWDERKAAEDALAELGWRREQG